jgi:glycosyltransferase involved in cell wall biosynthesis
MAAGLPVVAFKVDGVAETVLDGQTGYLIPPGNTQRMAEATLSILETPARAAEMKQQAQERVKNHFTAAGTAAQISQIIETLL